MKAFPDVCHIVFAFTMAWLLAVWIVAANGGHGEEENLDSISPERVKLLIESREKVIFIDLRPVSEFKEKRLPGARSIPLAELDKRLREVPKVGRVVLYCACRPGDDAYANFFLRDNGYRNIAVLEEGFSGWVKRKYPVGTERK